jgi:hypothetical protein
MKFENNIGDERVLKRWVRDDLRRKDEGASRKLPVLRAKKNAPWKRRTTVAV